jgi:hypothetical protein
MKYLCLIFVLGFSIYGNSQCGLTKASYAIIDLLNEKSDTTNIPILVSGALNNNLSTAQQGLCGVKLTFRHPFMKELEVELISPAGQKVKLIGGQIVAENTSLIRWDVTFVPCASSPNPDPGILPQWENDQDWEIGQIYTGQYHPHFGCLEQFNLGTVNGSWTLRCIDNDDEGTGAILGAQLIFCQPEGLFCNDCIIDPGIINNADINICEKDPALLINVNKTFSTPVQDNNVYEYTNVIFSETSIIKYEKTPDLRSLPSGKYTICGLQYAKSQSSVIPLQGTSSSPEGLRQFLFERGACAGLSLQCMTVTISTPPVPVNRVASICKGDVFEIGGQRFNQTGIYTVNVKGPLCDSTIILDLRVISLMAQITNNRDSINCLNPTMPLIGSNAGTVLSEITYLWKSKDGTFLGDTTLSQVTIGKEGVYELIIKSPEFGCADSISKTIFKDNTFTKITFITDTLTCEKESVNILFSLSRPVSEQKWRSKNGKPFSIINNGITVSESDWYFLAIKDFNGCVSEDSVFVTRNQEFIDPVLEANIITCIIDTAKIINIHNVPAGHYQYSWTGVAPQFSNLKEPFYLIGGNFKVDVKNLKNGCSKIFDIVIDQDKTTPSIDVSETNINCAQIAALPKVTSDQNINRYRWTGPGFFSESSSPQIREIGNYKLVITSAQNGCTAEANFEISRDTNLANITFMAGQLSCNVDSASIITTSDRDLKSVSWTGPQGYTSTLMSPKVGLAGTYIFNFTGINGCTGQKLISVNNSAEVPNVVFRNDSLRCGKDTVQLKILNASSVTNTYLYNWSGPQNFSDSSAEPFVSLPGAYRVTVTNPVSGCKIERQYSISDDRIYSNPQVIFDTISCIRDSARISFLNNDIKSVKVTGDNFISESKNTIVYQPGFYDYIIINNKNCPSSGRLQIVRNDTIPVVQAVSGSIKCNQDSVLMLALSSITGTQFVWKNNSGFFAEGKEVYAYKGGQYSVEGIAPNGCKSKFDFNIGFDTLRIPFEIIKPDTITCIRKEITLKTNLNQPKGTLKWNSGGLASFDLKVTNPGHYIATYTAENNCISVDSVIVEEKRNYPGYETESSIITCKNLLSSAIVIPKTEQNTITWKNTTNPVEIANGTFSFNTSFKGNYTFILTNPEGCETEGLLVISSDTSAPVILKQLSDTLTCQRLATEIGVELAEPAIEYLWNGPGVIDVITENLLRINQGGIYFLKITGRNNCVTNAQFSIVRNVDLPKFTTFTDTLTCDNAKINIGVNPLSNISNYEWKGPDDFTSELGHPKVFGPGTYTVTVTGANGCSSIAEIKVTQNITKPQISMPDIVLLPCDTSPVSLKLSTDSIFEKYRWVFPDGEIFNSVSPQTNIPGNYLVQVAGKNGCTSTLKRFVVKINDVPPVFSVKSDTINCSKNIANLQVFSNEAGFSNQWISPSKVIFTTPAINTMESGEFTLIVSNQQKCKDTLKVNIVRDTLVPVSNIVVKGEIQCDIKSLTLEGTKPANDNISFKWSTTSGNFISTLTLPTVKVNKPGLYFYELRNNLNKCIAISQVQVNEVAQRFSNFDVEVIPPICSEVNNGILKLTSFNGTAPYAIDLNGVKKGNQIQFFNLQPGNFMFMVTDSFGCKIEKQVTMPIGPNLSIKIDKEIKILFGDSVLLKPELELVSSGRAVLKWTKGDSTIICGDCKELTVSPYVNTVYNLEYSLDGFCKKNASILVRVENDIESSIPNIFAPFSLGSNQFFYIPQTRGIEKINYIKIFDRWAENVYSGYDLIPGDISTGWNGQFNGKMVQPGVFVVLAELVLADGTVWQYKGDVTVIR